MKETNLLEEQPIAWTPSPEVIERAQLTKFMRQIGVSTWDEMYEFSIRDVERFTEEVLKFLDIKFDPPYEKLLDVSTGVEFPVWFSSPPRRRDAESVPAAAAGDLTKPIREPELSMPGAGLNITMICLDRWQTDEMKDQPAVIWEGEEGVTRTFTYGELLNAVKGCAGRLEKFEIKRGDAVGIHMPMVLETVVALLAINRIGAIAVPVFSGYGVEAIASRLNAVKARALFTCYGFPRRGKEVDALAVAAEAARSVTTLRYVFVNDRSTGDERGEREIEFLRCGSSLLREAEERLSKLENELFPGKQVELWSASGKDDIFARAVAWADEAEPTSAEDPLIILYTSGTTGKPKGIAHTHASFPIKAAQDMAFGTDVGRGTRISWYTDIGWMMGPWLIYGALINGATICICDGAPDYPTPDRMWEFCAKHKVEVLGISPTLIRSLSAAEEAGTQASRLHERETRTNAGQSTASNEDETTPPNGVAGGTPALQSKAPFERHDLSSLRIFASTGEPWNPAPWWWLFERVGNSKLPIINYSGGTEIAGGILMGNPLLPIKPCSFPAPCPGMDVDILDDEGKPVEAGKVGELVIKQPWIGMARGFWQEKERYLETYWRRFEDIWVHGDWAMRDRDGHWFILGRSDDTLKIAGKRVGPAEVESLLVAHPLVTEAAVIGVPDNTKGTAMVAFVVGPPTSMPASEQDSRTLAFESELKTLVAKDMGKPLAPSRVHFVSALPKTRNAKVMRRVIRAAYLGEDPGDLSSLENPQAVKEIAAIGTNSA